jgi:hypothetical protein
MITSLVAIIVTAFRQCLATFPTPVAIFAGGFKRGNILASFAPTSLMTACQALHIFKEQSIAT